MNRVAKIFVSIMASTLLLGCSKAENFEDVDLAKLSQLDYCELRKAPDLYEGRVVRISARIGNFGHGYYFDDERCNAKTYENLLDDDKTEVTFFEPRAAELNDALEREAFFCCDGTLTSFTAIGRFTREYPMSRSDRMPNRTSFHFELFSLEPSPNSDVNKIATQNP